MKKIIPIVVVLAIIAVGGYTLLTGGKISTTGNSFSVTKTITSKSETFTGDLKAAVLKGEPYKCVFKTNQGTQGTGYIKNKQYYGDLVVDGKAGYIVMRDNCMWTWEKNIKQGAKVCFEGDIWASDGKESNTPTGDYTCTLETTISDDLFIIPKDVKFFDADNPMEE
jgi:hypothetical protein